MLDAPGCIIPGKETDNMANESPPDPLDPLLGRLSPPRTAPIGKEVWSRIAGNDREARSRSGLWAAIESVFRQPAFALAFVVACGLLGLLLAEMRVSRTHAERDVQLVRSYMQLIDPLLAAQDVASTEAGRKETGP